MRQDPGQNVAGRNASIGARLQLARELAYLECAAAVYACVPDQIRSIARGLEYPSAPIYFLSRYADSLVWQAERRLLTGVVPFFGAIAESTGAKAELRRTLPLVFGAFNPARLAERHRRGELDERDRALVRWLMQAGADANALVASSLVGMHVAYRLLRRPATDLPLGPRLPSRAHALIGNWLRDQTFLMSQGQPAPPPQAFIDLVESFESAVLHAILVGGTVHFLISGPRDR